MMQSVVVTVGLNVVIPLNFVKRTTTLTRNRQDKDNNADQREEMMVRW